MRAYLQSSAERKGKVRIINSTFIAVIFLDSDRFAAAILRLHSGRKFPFPSPLRPRHLCSVGAASRNVTLSRDSVYQKAWSVCSIAGEEQFSWTSAAMANNLDDLMTKLDSGTIMFRLPSRKRGRMEKKRFSLRADTCEVHQLPVNSTSRHQYPEEICEYVYNVEGPPSGRFSFCLFNEGRQ